jgi:hypothetical protein
MVDDAEVSAMMTRTQAALAATQPPEKVAITAPGVSIKIAADETDGDDNGGRGRVAIDVGGVSIHVDGDDDGGGRGAVKIGGVDSKAAAKFIEGIDEMSPEVKAKMREKLGL